MGLLGGGVHPQKSNHDIWKGTHVKSGTYSGSLLNIRSKINGFIATKKNDGWQNTLDLYNLNYSLYLKIRGGGVRLLYGYKLYHYIN